MQNATLERLRTVPHINIYISISPWFDAKGTHSHLQPHTLFLLSCLLRAYLSYLSCEKGFQPFSHTHRTHFQSHTHSDTSSIATDTHSHTHAILILQKVFPWGWCALLLELPRSRKCITIYRYKKKNSPMQQIYNLCVCVVYYMDRTPGATVTRMSACVPRKLHKYILDLKLILY